MVGICGMVWSGSGYESMVGSFEPGGEATDFIYTDFLDSPHYVSFWKVAL